MKGSSLKISLVIPLYNEENSLRKLVESINQQTFQPDEIILVDGGSIDKTVEVFEKLCSRNPVYKLIKTERATPGKGRNIGIENARNQWIALTDAGIKLKNDWLENLSRVVRESPSTDIVYGNFAPTITNLFEKCAVFAYVTPQGESGIRAKFIASSLLKKEVWQKVDGFPDLRAAEDLMFMDEIERQGFSFAYAPEAMVYWQLRPDFFSTFRKFVLYSKNNVWAKRQWQWHHGIVKQYLLVLPFVVLSVLHSSWWLIAIVGWVFARTAKRILMHRNEFGFWRLLNPFVFLGSAFLILTVDFATFVGWIQAILHKKPDNFMETHA